ncbi:MAG: hypothetical protein V1877_00310 [Candidatus Tagabacteria bacterium]
MRNNVFSLIGKISRQRGFGAEAAVSMAFAEMKKGGEIASFYKTARRADKFQGIDFFVIRTNGDKVPFQVKSSFSGAMEHQKKFPGVPVIVVKSQDDTETVKSKIRGTLK